MLVAGKTPNIFLLAGISNINTLFIKKKNNGVVNSKLQRKINVSLNKSINKSKSIYIGLGILKKAS